MLYQRRSFTLPAQNPRSKELNWDLAFLSDKEFIEKYRALKEEIINEQY